MAKGKKIFLVSGVLSLDMSKFKLGLNQASKDLGNYARKQQKTFTELKRTFGTLQGGFGQLAAGVGLSLSAKEALLAGDAYQAMQRRLEMVTKATGDYAAVSQSVYDISQKTYVRLADTERTFRALQMAGKDFGATNKDILKVVDAANKLGVMGGASNEQLSGAMLQFSQVMGKGRLMSQELNLIAENMQPLAEAIKKGLGMNMADLRKQMELGKVTAQMVFGAILKQTKEIDAQFQSFVPTLGQQFNKMANAFAKVIGSDAQSGVQLVGSGMQLITEHMQAAVNIGFGVAIYTGAVLALNSVGSLIATFERFMIVTKAVSGWIAAKTAATAADTAATGANTAATGANLTARELEIEAMFGSTAAKAANSAATAASTAMTMAEAEARAGDTIAMAAYTAAVNANTAAKVANNATPIVGGGIGLGGWMGRAGLVGLTGYAAYKGTRAVMSATGADEYVQRGMMSMMNHGQNSERDHMGARTVELLEKVHAVMERQEQAARETARNTRRAPGLNNMEPVY